MSGVDWTKNPIQRMHEASMHRTDQETHLYGLWWGLVVDNQDPLGTGRVRVRVVGVHDDIINTPDSDIPWAFYCSPFGSGDAPLNGFYMIPRVGDQVVVSFIQGHRDFPVWMGCVPGCPQQNPTNAETPEDVRSRDGVDNPEDKTLLYMIRTPSGHKIMLDDHPDGMRVTIETGSGQYIRLDDDDERKLDILIQGNAHARIEGDAELNIDGDMRINVGSNTTINTSGETRILSGGDIRLSGSNIFMN